MAKKKQSEEKRALPHGGKYSDKLRKWREATVVVFVLFAVLMVVGFFAPNAKVLSFVNKLSSWLFGPGLFAVPIVLLGISGHILLRLNKNLRTLWIIAMSALPLLVGSFGHLFVASDRYPPAEVGKLCADGAEFLSGGLIAGGFTELLIIAFSKVGAGILLFTLAAALVLVVFRIPLSLIMNKASDKMEKTGEKAHELRINQKAQREERRKLHAERAAEEAQARAAAEKEKQEKEELRARTAAKTRRIDFSLDSDMPAATPANPHDEEPVFATPESVAKKTENVSEVPAVSPSDENGIYTVKATPAGDGKIKVPETPDEPVGSDEPAQTPFEQLVSAVESELPPWEEPEVDLSTGEVISFPFEQTDFPDEDFTADETENSRPTMSPEELEEAVAATAASAGEGFTGSYVFPPIELLKSAPPPSRELTDAETLANQDKLISTLASFGVGATIVGVTRGPAVTRYEIQLGSGIKIARISNLSKDIALSMGAPSVRVSNIPEKFAVGIEVPNKNVETVFLRDVIESPEFSNARSGATFALGKDISGRPVVGDISRLPHVLVGGTTNSGKSVCINSLLISLIYKSSPDDLRLILIDPKMVEFASYNGIPHLLIPVVTDYKKAAGALQWAVMEMEERYKRFNGFGFRNFAEYNEAVDRMNAENEGNENAQKLERLPRIIIVIDELADLMMTSPKEVEAAICRLAQKARAAGMNLVVATQRPSADVIKGTMKANIPSRIAFSVASSLESRIILDRNGAETLLGRGDMLFLPIGATDTRRVQGCFVSSPEIESVVAFIKNGVEVQYSEEIMRQIDRAADGGGSDPDENSDEERDELFDEAVSFCLGTNQCSATMLQRKLKVGFARAARIVDQMEACGIVGPSEGAKSRKMLISREDWQEMQYRRSSDY
ncbi:MAG: DNA translocase FtsK [Clostridia bacterium]|nr:DNA translocase FtsK [Clostridia bacterium]